MGLLLLVPPLREALIRHGASRFTVRAASFVRTSQPQPQPRGNRTIDADYEVVDEGMPRSGVATPAGRSRTPDRHRPLWGGGGVIDRARPTRGKEWPTMADQRTNGEASGAGGSPGGAALQILTQYIRDLSFENIAAQKGVAAEASPRSRSRSTSTPSSGRRTTTR